MLWQRLCHHFTSTCSDMRVFMFHMHDLNENKAILQVATLKKSNNNN